MNHLWCREQPILEKLGSTKAEHKVPVALYLIQDALNNKLQLKTLQNEAQELLNLTTQTQKLLDNELDRLCVVTFYS